MKARIYRSTVAIVLASLLVFSLILSAGLYFVFARSFQAQLHSELSLLSAAMNRSPEPDEVFSLWAEQSGSFRLTLIAPDGTVLADTGADASQMENHAARSEIASALETGFGASHRQSATLDEMTF